MYEYMYSEDIDWSTPQKNYQVLIAPATVSWSIRRVECIPHTCIFISYVPGTRQRHPVSSVCGDPRVRTSEVCYYFSEIRIQVSWWKATSNIDVNRTRRGKTPQRKQNNRKLAIELPNAKWARGVHTNATNQTHAKKKKGIKRKKGGLTLVSMPHSS